jgi:Kef-type K+ transport system membrane component KefB
MTAVSALLLAITTGWLVPAPRLAMAAFLGPWLVALIYQTADIGLGYAVSPPQVVTQFPRVIGYVVVTAVILSLGLILSALIGDRRSRAVPVAGRQTARDMVRRATLAGTVVVAALITLDIVDHAVLVWPESTAHHTTNPSPPLFGILSIALCLIGIAVLGAAVLRRRAAARLGDQGTRTAGNA